MDRALFYSLIRRSLFSGDLTQEQVDGIEGILNAFEDYGDGRDKTLAYALATAHHETGRMMVPVREGFAKSDASARRVVARRKYGKPGAYGHVFYGRGHVQLTWEANYRETGRKIGVDLVKEPDRMLDPEVSARVLIEGLLDGRWNGKYRKGIAHYLPTGGPDDLRGARRTVNITDKWELIAGYYYKYLGAIQASKPLSKVAERPVNDRAIGVGVDTSKLLLREGSSGMFVGQLQEKLKALGFYAGEIDRDFGPKTKDAVIAFQKSRGLRPDGVFGPRTHEALNAALTKRPEPQTAAASAQRSIWQDIIDAILGALLGRAK